MKTPAEAMLDSQFSGHQSRSLASGEGIEDRMLVRSKGGGGMLRHA